MSNLMQMCSDLQEKVNAYFLENEKLKMNNTVLKS